MILYGSRARGDFREYSDWDIFILLTKVIDFKQEVKLRYKLYDIEIESGEILNLIFENLKYWNSKRNSCSPYYQSVVHEGIYL
ncbi:MAG TPA: nucleotidyltransferase domain-containing protein [Candidatus Cloacimonetes bacterium]|nr:nucleotidyltransferase domain-containing protein [Candidatus Cloacimonadota bacterium]